MNIIKKSALILFVMLAPALTSGCNDKYDGLLVQDGNGNIYKLEHRVGDAYFVHIQNRDETGAHDETNKKLIEKAKAESE